MKKRDEAAEIKANMAIEAIKALRPPFVTDFGSTSAQVNRGKLRDEEKSCYETALKTLKSFLRS